jgi:hypothetical protein
MWQLSDNQIAEVSGGTTPDFSNVVVTVTSTATDCTVRFDRPPPPSCPVPTVPR